MAGFRYLTSQIGDRIGTLARLCATIGHAVWTGMPLMTPRQFLGKELCRARLTAGFSSPQALADHLGFERTVIAKAESGDRVPSDPVLTAWAKACNIDIEHYQRLAELARTSDGPVPAWFEYWLERERTAHMLRYWSPLIMTPIFQTAGYARALLLAAQTDTSDEAINPLVEAKLERATILDRAEPRMSWLSLTNWCFTGWLAHQRPCTTS